MYNDEMDSLTDQTLTLLGDKFLAFSNLVNNFNRGILLEYLAYLLLLIMAFFVLNFYPLIST